MTSPMDLGLEMKNALLLYQCKQVFALSTANLFLFLDRVAVASKSQHESAALLQQKKLQAIVAEYRRLVALEEEEEENVAAKISCHH